MGSKRQRKMMKANSHSNNHLSIFALYSYFVAYCSWRIECSVWITSIVAHAFPSLPTIVTGILAHHCTSLPIVTHFFQPCINQLYALKVKLDHLSSKFASIYNMYQSVYSHIYTTCQPINMQAFPIMYQFVPKGALTKGLCAGKICLNTQI